MPNPDDPPPAATLPPELRRIEALHGFQRRSWTAERLGWLGMLAVVLLGLLGGLGGAGPLSSATAETPDGALRIAYQRTQRLMAPTVFRIEATATAAAGGPDGRLELRLGRDFLARWKVTAMVPSPAETRGDAEGLVLAFRVRGAGPSPALLLHALPEAPGLAQVAIGTAGEPPAMLRILVWP